MDGRCWFRLSQFSAFGRAPAVGGRVLAAIALGVSLLAAERAAGQEGPTPGPRGPDIVSDGEGLRVVAADRASVIVSVQTRSRTPSQAGSLNASRNNAVRAAIEGLGVPRADIVTYGYTVYVHAPDPHYAGDTGYVATNSLRVTLRRPEQLALLGRVIDTALTAGATHIAGVRHEARRTDEAERDALADALADARARAEVIARAAGGSLGELLQVVTNASGLAATVPLTGAEAGMMRAARSARIAYEPTTVTPGEIELRQYVVARWRFVPRAR